MSPGEYFTPTDLDALRRESELLALENGFLKGRIRNLERRLNDLRKRYDAVQQELSQLQTESRTSEPA